MRGARAQSPIAARASASFSTLRIAKAPPTECFNGVGKPYPHFLYDAQGKPACVDPATGLPKGSLKVNAGYVWGMTETANRYLWFGTGPNVQCFEMEELMHSKAAVLAVLGYLFDRFEERFDGAPTLLILDESWLFLDDPVFAARIRQWLKTLRKKNVSVIFATQSLADIKDSSIAPAIIESCASRIFLPNPQATEPQIRTIYEGFGLNSRQIQIVATAQPKRDYYYQSRAGNRLFDLDLGPVALAFAGASSPQDQRAIDGVLRDAGAPGFAGAWLRHRGLDWAADLLPAAPVAASFPSQPQENLP